MAYNDDAVKAKLSALNETQESIVTVAQWVMFHRRHADRTAQLWLQRLKDSGAGKRLNLIYLANEVAQQSKVRKKDDFLIAFSPIIAEATATAYKGGTNEVQQKLRRVVEVWRQRQIFETPIQEAIEARVNEIDKTRSSGKKPLLGGSIFSNSSGPSAPSELQPLVPLQISVSKAAIGVSGSAPAAKVEYEKHEKLMDPIVTDLPPAVHAARLNGVLKKLASAEGAVSESIKARESLVEALEQLLEINRIALASEKLQHSELVTRKATVEATKREVEDGIMRGLSAESGSNAPQTSGSIESHTNGNSQSKDPAPTEPERPQMEELTPPPTGSLTPTGSYHPAEEAMFAITPAGDITHEQQPSYTDPPPAVQPALAHAGSDLLSSFTMPPAHAYGGSPIGGGTLKKRKMDFETDFTEFDGGDAMADLDEDVAELLRAESGGGP
ncbi:MAG: hypothetical protein Q9187_002848 [Circinaria calcarea]